VIAGVIAVSRSRVAGGHDGEADGRENRNKQFRLEVSGSGGLALAQVLRSACAGARQTGDMQTPA